jgi:DDE superfamily endonuclease
VLSRPRPTDQVNLTDEESLIMPVAGGGFEQCYNAHAVMAAGSLGVVATDVVQATNDKSRVRQAGARTAALAPSVGKPQGFQRCRALLTGILPSTRVAGRGLPPTGAPHNFILACRAALQPRSHQQPSPPAFTSLTVEWLPKYTPELNDIEAIWHNLKAPHRAHQTVTGVNALDQAIHAGVEALNLERMVVPLAKPRISA